MNDTKKPTVVWPHPHQIARLRANRASTYGHDGGVQPECRPHLLLPVEDGALRVGDYVFRRDESGHPIWRQPGVDKEGEWWADGDDMLFDLLMDAAEGVEP